MNSFIFNFIFSNKIDRIHLPLKNGHFHFTFFFAILKKNLSSLFCSAEFCLTTKVGLVSIVIATLIFDQSCDNLKLKPFTKEPTD